MLNHALLAIGKDWWLPPNYSVHGRQIDTLFQWFFWITMFVLVAVQALIVVFAIRYRARAVNNRATHLHGNTRLEMVWTAIPLFILAMMAYGSERVWENYRASPDLENKDRSKILIIGQQYIWNVIYPGPDGKFGRYLVFPKPTDLTWPIGPDGNPVKLAEAPGPAFVPYKQAVELINKYIATDNPLGKDFTDPDGKDDNWEKLPGRPIYVPVNRPVEVQLESEDVIHDFFMPNFRVQLYAVPGMAGHFVFTPTVTTKELEAASKQNITIEELIVRQTDPANADLVIDIDADSKGAQHDKTGWRYARSSAKNSKSFIRDGNSFPPREGDSPSIAEQLKAAGIQRVTVHKPQPFEIACAQLCGIGHYKMRGEMIVLSQEEFDRLYPAAPHGSK